MHAFETEFKYVPVGQVVLHLFVAVLRKKVDLHIVQLLKAVEHD